MFRTLISTLFFLLTNHYTHSQSIDSINLKDQTSQIISKNREMEAAFAANDMMKVASFYSDSCLLIGENVLIKGREKTNAYWISLKDRGISWRLENIKIDACDSLAVQQGISKLVYMFQGREQLSVVRFTLVWKRVNGEWLIEVDHYSTI
jgi:ketosteroid isomerase-like protein